VKEKNDQPIKAILKGWIDNSKIKSKLKQVEIKQLWRQMMGPSISNYTTDILIRKNKMYITISSAPLKQELSYGKEKIKKMINDEIGEEFVKEVIIR